MEKLKELQKKADAVHKEFIGLVGKESKLISMRKFPENLSDIQGKKEIQTKVKLEDLRFGLPVMYKSEAREVEGFHRSRSKHKGEYVDIVLVYLTYKYQKKVIVKLEDLEPLKPMKLKDIQDKKLFAPKNECKMTSTFISSKEITQEQITALHDKFCNLAEEIGLEYWKGTAILKSSG